jgi:hypothetical protein
VSRPDDRARARPTKRRVPGIWQAGGWRRAVAIGGAAYCLVAWVLPVVIVAIFRELPYLEQRPFLERLAFSAAGTTVLVAAMVAAFPRRTLIYKGRTVRETAANGLLAFLGLAMFTAAAAYWSGNTLGVVAKLMPGDGYSSRFTVIDVDASRRFFALTLHPRQGRREARLPLSRWLFGRPEVREGDEILARGKRNWAGIYIDSIEVSAAVRRPPG